ncbi:MAG TPA: glycosyltransferase family 4 protein [Deltaproteobacteria bacterium]|nr:glycosyltransferase family 4 protein [Deltaproteobacteria bacterium]
MKIVLIIGTLKGGGAERILSAMANHWQSKGHSITLVTHDAMENDFYPLRLGINRIGLNLTGPTEGIVSTIRQRIRKITALRRIMKDLRPDVVISFTYMTNCESIMALSCTGIPLIISERNNPVTQEISRAWKTLRTLLYPLADAVVLQTEGAARWAQRYLDPEKLHVIPNFVNLNETSLQKEDLDLSEAKHFILAAGRLTRQKGFDLLIEAFSIAAGDRKDWSLVILGEGEDRTFLEDLAIRLSVQDRVIMPGKLHNIRQIMEKSDMFVLSSRYEGFPNVLLEAMALGLPVISTDCPFGPAYIVRHGIDGILVPNQDTEAIAHAIHSLMENDAERRRLASRSREVLDRFDKESIMHKWDILIGSLAVPGV